MARSKGIIQTANNFELGRRKPLDARQLVNNISDLTNVSTWEKYKNDDGTYYNNAFNGMIVACAEDGCLYVLVDKEKLTSPDEGWNKFEPSAELDVDNINITIINGGNANGAD